MLNSAIQKTLQAGKLLFIWTYKLAFFVKQSRKLVVVKHVCLNTSTWLLKHFGMHYCELASWGKKVVSLHLFTDCLHCGLYWIGSVRVIFSQVALYQCDCTASNFEASIMKLCRPVHCRNNHSEFLNTTYSERFVWDFAPLQWPQFFFWFDSSPMAVSCNFLYTLRLWLS